MQIRMDKFLADAGFGTRSEVKKKLKTETVMVDGVRIRDAAFRFDPEKQQVTVNGKAVSFQLLSYYMLNKPKGVVSATKDPMEKTVVDLVPDGRRRDLFPVGRLDKDTEGLLIITNDGQLSHRLLSPKHHVKKEYLVLYRGAFSPEAEEMLRTGVDIGDEKPTFPAELTLLSPATCILDVQNSDETENIDIHLCLIGITEGRYHEIKRMFAAVGSEVISLKRVSMGKLRLDPSLLPGESRQLTPEELMLLNEG